MTMSQQRPAARPRLRDLGITIGTLPPGPLNAITDVPGVRVGQTTLISGDGPMEVGKGPVRTGVTAIHPHEGNVYRDRLPVAVDVLNGAGELTGLVQIDEFGTLETPILLTNTLSVGTAHQACVEWLVEREPTLRDGDFVTPVVAETFDGFLNDVAGAHLKPEHVYAALDSATVGPVAEGNVGGGTGMILFGFKGGNGTASRTVTIGGEAMTVGVFVQGNFGKRRDLLVDGVPVGRAISDLLPERGAPSAGKDGSVIVVIGTDAPLSDRQLGRLCRRGMLGLGRVGAVAHDSSGDILLAFSNTPGNRIPRDASEPFLTSRRIADEWMNDLFEATIEATAEAVLNALVAAETMTGRDGHVVHALPHDRLRDIVRAAGRLREPGETSATERGG